MWFRRKKPHQTFMLEPVEETIESDPAGRPPEREINPDDPRSVAMKSYEEATVVHEHSIAMQRKKVEHDRRA